MSFNAYDSELKTGWLSPSGELIECDTYNHIEKASHIVEKYNYRSRDDYSKMPDDDILVDRGWVHITISCFTHLFEIYWNLYGRLTKAQEKFLAPYMVPGKTENIHIEHYYFDLSDMDYN